MIFMIRLYDIVMCTSLINSIASQLAYFDKIRGLLERPIWQGVGGSFWIPASKELRPSFQQLPRKRILSITILEADPSPAEPSDMTPTLADTWIAAR